MAREAGDRPMRERTGCLPGVGRAGHGGSCRQTRPGEDPMQLNAMRLSQPLSVLLAHPELRLGGRALGRD